MLIKVGILKSKIITDNPDLLKTLLNRYSFRIPGVEFSQAYRRSSGWDGKKYFINAKGVFRSGLLNRVLTDLSSISCTPKIEYSYDNSEYTLNNYDIKQFSYYPFQKALIEKALKDKCGIVKAPTGSGKTLIMAGLVKALNNHKIVILFNAKQLLKQTYDFFTKTCGLDNIGLCFGEGYIYGDCMLCTVQSIEKILETHLEDTKVLMVDECHEFSKGRTFLPAIQSFNNAEYRVGFTATPPNEDIPKFNLEGALGPVWEQVNTSSLIEDGNLTKPIIQLVNRDYTLSGLDEDMSYENIYQDYIVNNVDRNNIIKDIVDDIKKRNKKARVLILTKSLDHGRTLENLLGDDSEFLEGANSIGERYKAISRFRGRNKSSILIGTKILQTGINIEEITHFINARGMKSEIATLQALGRALRKHESKDKVYIYDFLDKEKYLKTHSSARKKWYIKEGHEVTVL
jgi:superfamily II DNA or RNA helicase